MNREDFIGLIYRESGGIYSPEKAEDEEDLIPLKKLTTSGKAKKSAKYSNAVKPMISNTRRNPQDRSNSPVPDNLKRAPSIQPEPLTPSHDIFWKGSELPDESLLAAIPDIKTYANLPKKLGQFPFWRGNEAFLETMTKLYQKASENTAALLANDE
jgi:uncharacterized Zn finger protein